MQAPLLLPSLNRIFAPATAPEEAPCAPAPPHPSASPRTERITIYDHEQTHSGTGHSEHHLQHHRPAAGHGRFGYRRTPGQRHRHRSHRRGDGHLQLHLLELRLPAHGHQRIHRTGLRSPAPGRVRQPAGAGHDRSGRTGGAAARLPALGGTLLPVDNADRGRSAASGRGVLLRPHLGRSRHRVALRHQRLVHRHAGLPHPHGRGHRAEHRQYHLQPLVLLRAGDGHHGHRLGHGGIAIHGRGDELGLLAALLPPLRPLHQLAREPAPAAHAPFLQRQ